MNREVRCAILLGALRATAITAACRLGCAIMRGLPSASPVSLSRALKRLEGEVIVWVLLWAFVFAACTAIVYWRRQARA